MANEFVVKNGLISKGAVNASGFNVTADNFVGSASYALNSQTSSWAENAHSVDNAGTATSASYATRASNADSSSYSTSALTASYARSVSTVTSASFSDKAHSADTSTSASFSSQTISSSFALSAANADSASWAPGSGTSNSSSWASSSLSSSYAISASQANSVDFYYVLGSDLALGIGTYRRPNIAGNADTFIGVNAGLGAVDVIGSTVIGRQALANATGHLTNSVVIGDSAGQSLATDTTQLLAIGESAGIQAISCSYSTFVGCRSGVHSTASYSTLLGCSSSAAGILTNVIAIGYTASVTQSNSTVIGSPATTTATIYGNTQLSGTLIGSASYATSASWAPTGVATSASFATNAHNSDLSTSASFASELISPDPSVTAGLMVNTGSWATRLNSYTIDNTDDGRTVIVNSGSQLTITLTTASINAGFNALYYQSGSGRITFATASTSVFMRNRANQTGSAGQYSLVSIIRVPNGDFVFGGDTG